MQGEGELGRREGVFGGGGLLVEVLVLAKEVAAHDVFAAAAELAGPAALGDEGEVWMALGDEEGGAGKGAFVGLDVAPEEGGLRGEDAGAPGGEVQGGEGGEGVEEGEFGELEGEVLQGVPVEVEGGDELEVR